MKKYICGSPTNPRGEDGWLSFPDYESAVTHKELMDKNIETFDAEYSLWNKSYWITKPEPWQIKEKL